MADEPDGVDEAFEGVLRIGLTAAGRVAEVIARSREQAAHEARAASEQEARELGARLDAERAFARAQLAPVQRVDWWDTAKPEAIARAWETARAWELDPDAGRASERIRQEVRARYGVDVDAPGGDPQAVREALERRGVDHEDQAAGDRGRGALEQVEAAQLLTDADCADRAQDAARRPERDPGLSSDVYDTVERRRHLAASLGGVVDAETIEVRVLADTSQGRPAHEAAAQGPKLAPNRRAWRVTGPVKLRGERLGR